MKINNVALVAQVANMAGANTTARPAVSDQQLVSAVHRLLARKFLSCACLPYCDAAIVLVRGSRRCPLNSEEYSSWIPGRSFVCDARVGHQRGKSRPAISCKGGSRRSRGNCPSADDGECESGSSQKTCCQIIHTSDKQLPWWRRVSLHPVDEHARVFWTFVREGGSRGEKPYLTISAVTGHGYLKASIQMPRADEQKDTPTWNQIQSIEP
jgi:hypothetical protein